MNNKKHGAEKGFSEIEIKFAKLIRHVLTSESNVSRNKEVIQYAYDVATYYEISLEAAQQSIQFKSKPYYCEEKQVMRNFQITEEELKWTATDTVKLSNQYRKFNNQPPLGVDNAMTIPDNSHLYPSKKDWARWEIMRNRA